MSHAAAVDGVAATAFLHEQKAPVVHDVGFVHDI